MNPQRNTIQKVYFAGMYLTGVYTFYRFIQFLLEVGSNGTRVSDRFWAVIQGLVITGLLYFISRPD
jgi:hypothetical protein